jgi:hypothetical protein
VPIAAVLLLIGAVLTVVGSALPWVKAAGETINGFTRGDTEDSVNDGPVLTFIAVLLAGFAITFLVAKRVFVLAILSVVFASFVILIGAADLGDAQDVRDFFRVFGDEDASVGAGLPVVIVGGLVALAGGIVSLAKRRR